MPTLDDDFRRAIDPDDEQDERKRRGLAERKARARADIAAAANELRAALQKMEKAGRGSQKKTASP